MKLSVIIPVYNEEGNVQPLYLGIKKALDNIYLNQYEVIFVDDGSRDNTFKVLTEINKKDSNVKIIRHRANFGQTAGLSTGFRYAKGEVIITMDGDCQNDPADIPKLLEKLAQGYDLVCGWRYNRKDSYLTKKVPSLIANLIRKAMIKDPVHDSGCSLKAFNGNVIKNIPLMSDAHRFLPAILKLEGYKVSEIKVKHHPRNAGQTKYGFTRLFKGLFDLMTLMFWYRYSKRPLHLFGGIGLFFIFAAIGIFMYILIKVYVILKIKMIISPLLLLIAILILVGLQFILFGFLGEMQAKAYYTANKPKLESEVIL